MKWWPTLKDRLEMAYIEALGRLLGKVWQWSIMQQTAAQHRIDLRSEAKTQGDRQALSDETPDMMFPQDLERWRPTWTGLRDEDNA